MSRLIGNQTGPRQLELPPNMPVSDSAGRYWTRYSWPCTAKTKGSSRWLRDSDRIPCGLRKRSSSSMRVRTRRSFALVQDRQQAPAVHSGHQRVGDAAQQVGVALVVLPGPGRQARKALEGLAGDDRDRAQGDQPHHRADPQARGRAVRQAEHVVEEAVLVVPHLVVGLADLVHGAGDPEEMLDELQGQVLVAGVARPEDQGQLEHVLAEQGHPGRAVGLLEVAAGRQRGAAVEDPDVVEAEEPAFEQVLAVRVLAVEPPGEVQQQLLEGVPQEIRLLLASGPAPAAYANKVAQACTGGLTSPKFHS